MAVRNIKNQKVLPLLSQLSTLWLLDAVLHSDPLYSAFLECADSAQDNYA